jgi:2,4-dienoyl-CoA reductase-like NADH-dependent reductase (Old Yellow Enzyme family)
MPAALGQPALAPSAVALEMGALSRQFAPPRAMTEADIEEVIARFIRSAELAERAGFSGVEIHAAHGYLLSQFLSPLSNRRDDRWGGSLHNRARLLLEIVQGVRATVSPTFAVAVKLNSADFQRGGFSPEDARVVEMLAPLGVDLVELSGGSYEAPAMTGAARRTQPGPRGLLPRVRARDRHGGNHAADGHRRHPPPRGGRAGAGQRRGHGRHRHRAGDRAGSAAALAAGPRPGADTAHINWRSKPLAASAHMAAVKYQLGG